MINAQTANRTATAPLSRTLGVEASDWLLRSPALGPARLRLFCFPYAGAGAAVYRLWPQALPPDVDVCLVQPPGRALRPTAEPFADLRLLVSAAAAALRPYFDLPFVLFGHSMGAIVAFELARHLRRQHQLAPALLVVSGSPGPQCPDTQPPLRHLPDVPFVHAVQARYNAIPPEILADPELVKFIVPSLKADVTALETYQHLWEPPLDCPLSVYGGREDLRVGQPEIEAWREHTRATLRVRMFPGGHFFVDSHRAAVLEALRDDLQHVADGGAGATS
jgi:surfactin synthase thioesterase subunit